MTRLLVIADMEGISGIERYEQCARGHPEYAEGVRLLCQEVNIITETALDCGVRTVSVIDWHGGGGNLDPDQLDERVEIVPEDLSPGYDLALLVGFHPMAGDQSGFISHTMTQAVALEVDGTEIGEISLLSWWLGEHGIPVGLISGDRAVTAEADRLFPDTPTHTVKRAESWARAVCVPVEQSYDTLKARLRHVLEQQGRWRIYRPSHPVRFRMLLRYEHATIPLIPWLERDEEGWLKGEVERTRDLIDLIDVVAALLALDLRNSQLAQLREDPQIEAKLDQMLVDRVNQAAHLERWSVHV